jgi:hypothetical protein
MRRIATVTLPRNRVPNFPDRCVTCGKAGPGSLTRLVANDLFSGGLSFFTVRVPCCRPCGHRLHAWRIWSSVRALLIAGLAVWLGIAILLPRLPDVTTGLIVLGLITTTFLSIAIWERIFPPAFAVDPGRLAVDYEFRDPEQAEEFARANGAVEVSAGAARASR